MKPSIGIPIQSLQSIRCPMCGSMALAIQTGMYTFTPPPNIPGGPIVIGKATWWACDVCGEHLLSHKLSSDISRVADRRIPE